MSHELTTGAVAQPRPRRTLWPWMLLALAVVAGALLLQVLDSLSMLDLPFRVSIDGVERFDGTLLSELTAGQKLLAASGVVFALLVVAVVVPMALLLAFVCAGLGILLALVFGVGLPAVVLVLVGGLLLSPLWLPALLIWWLVSRSRRRSNRPAVATIAA